MRTRSSAKNLFVTVATIAALTACTGGGSQMAPSSTGTRNAGVLGIAGMNGNRLPVVAPLGNVHIQKYHGKNWMEPGANKHRLLYVSDYFDNVVQVCNYPSRGTQNPPVGTLTGNGLEGPAGMCIDKHNNVYITNEGGEVLEYAYGASTPSANFVTDGGRFPDSCSIDPTSGNLAVSTIYNSSGFGTVTIFTSLATRRSMLTRAV